MTLLSSFILISWFVLCGAVGAIASKKGRSAVAGFAISFFLSPLVGLLVVLAMSSDETEIAAAQGKKKCPQCAEYVQPEARICRFCQHKFVAGTIPQIFARLRRAFQE